MEHSSTSYLPLLLVTGLAFIVPILARRIPHVPIVVGEIFAGIIIGRSGFNLIPDENSALTFLAEFGFTLLMFLSGLEIDVNILFRRSYNYSHKPPFWSRPVPISLLMLFSTICMATFSSYGLKHAGMIKDPLLMGLILSTTSLGVVLPVLKEQHLLAKRFGQYLLVAATLADFLTLLSLTAVIAISGKGLQLDILLIFVLLAVFALVARVGQRFATMPLLRKVINELAHATAQIRVRGALALMVALVVLAEALGVQVILGAFLAGAVVGLMVGTDESHLRTKLDAIGFGFFIPIFFINVGIEFNSSSLFASKNALLLIPILLIIAYIVKLVPALFLKRVFSFKEALSGGFLLSARLSLIIAASSIALKIGAIDSAVNAAVILTAIVTCTLSPFLFNTLHPSIEEEERKGIILVGTNQLGQLLARRLHQAHVDFCVVGNDQKVLKQLSHRNKNVVLGKANDKETLLKAGADRAEALVILCENKKQTIEIATLAKAFFEIPLVIAHSSANRSYDELKSLGVRIIQPTLAITIAIESALRFPTAFEVIVDTEDDVEMGEAILSNDSYDHMELRDIRLPGNTLIVGIQRNGSIIVPHGDAVLEKDDHLALVGSPDAIAQSIEILRG